MGVGEGRLGGRTGKRGGRGTVTRQLSPSLCLVSLGGEADSVVSQVWKEASLEGNQF